MTRYKNVEQYISTETVFYEDGVEVARYENCDTRWWDTEQSNIPVTEDEEYDYFGGTE